MVDALPAEVNVMPPAFEDQVLNANPLFGEAVIERGPAFSHRLEPVGVVVPAPAGETANVTKYCAL